MQNAKKFVLLDQSTYEKRLARDNANVFSSSSTTNGSTEKRLSEFDNEMRSVLESNEPDDVKAKLYANALNKFKSLSEQSTTTRVAKDFESVVTDDEILDSVHPAVRHKARRLLRIIRETSDMSWNGKGELVYKQETVPRSNIVELMNDVLKPKSHDRAVGWEEFASGLSKADIKINRELVPNNASWKIVEGKTNVDDTENVVNISSLFSDTSTPRKSVRQSRTKEKRTVKRRKRYGSWEEY